MSKVNYKRKENIYWDILCSVTINGEKKTYVYKSYYTKMQDALDAANAEVSWAIEPTFKTEVVGVRFE